MTRHRRRMRRRALKYFGELIAFTAFWFVLYFFWLATP